MNSEIVKYPDILEHGTQNRHSFKNGLVHTSELLFQAL